VLESGVIQSIIEFRCPLSDKSEIQGPPCPKDRSVLLDPSIQLQPSDGGFQLGVLVDLYGFSGQAALTRDVSTELGISRRIQLLRSPKTKMPQPG
jgi:hypothetical protein